MRVIIVGAGMAGLVAGAELTAAGHDVTIFDKGRSVGGRMATRRIGPARLDHGAQFFTVRSDDFDTMVQKWSTAGVVREWCRGFSSIDGHPRYVGADGMTSIAKFLAHGLDIRCSTLVFSTHREGPGWVVVTDDGARHSCDVLVITAPIPQALSLVFSSGVDLPTELLEIEYDRTIGLLVALEGPGHRVGVPGALQNQDSVFSFIADNRAKGISDIDALTFHANAQWSLEHWDTASTALAEDLLRAASPHIGDATIVEAQVKKWRFAVPQSTWPDSHWKDDSGTLFLAGDAYAGPRVEGAALSGLSVARALTS